MSRWDAFQKYCVRVTPILEAISHNGLGIDPTAQREFFDTLTRERDAIYDTIQGKIPLHVFNIKSWKRKPKIVDEDGLATVTIGHKDDEKLTVKVKLIAYPEGGVWARLPFSPRSWQQVQELAAALGAKLPRKQDAEDDDDTSTDDKALKRVSKKFPVFEDIRQYRKRDKLITSYNWKLSESSTTGIMWLEVPVETTIEQKAARPSLQREDKQTRKVVEKAESRQSGSIPRNEAKGIRSEVSTAAAHPLHIRGTWVGEVPKSNALPQMSEALYPELLAREANHPSYGLGSLQQLRGKPVGSLQFVPQQLSSSVREPGHFVLPIETSSTTYRVHPQFGFHTSTWRKSCRQPNIQTIPKRSDLAKQFRKMIVPRPGNVLIEGDSAAIEAVIVGWLAGSERYIRLARAGVHGWLTSALHGKPISLDISDAALTAACQQAKLEWPDDYEKCKRVVHLSNYCGTPHRIAEEYPDEFPRESDAARLQNFYFDTAPGKDIKAWQKHTVEIAHANKGLEGHFGLRHRFYSLYSYDNRRKIYVLGDDAKRAVAFVPQSDASFVQSDILLRLVERDERFLQWLVAIIHDSCVLDLPKRDADYAAGVLYQEMTRPLLQLGGLWVGAEVKIGFNLAEMKTWKLGTQSMAERAC